MFGQASAAAGVNVLGLDSQETNGLILTVSVMVKTREHEAFAYPRAQEWVRTLRQFAAGVGANQDWLYTNYSDKSQDPLATYGAENFRFLREVAARYDPDGVFQKQCPGGFKLWREEEGGSRLKL